MRRRLLAALCAAAAMSWAGAAIAQPWDRSGRERGDRAERSNDNGQDEGGRRRPQQSQSPSPSPQPPPQVRRREGGGEQGGPPPNWRARAQNPPGGQQSGPPPNLRRRTENGQGGPPPDWRRRIENAQKNQQTPPPNVRRRIENNQGGPPSDWRRRIENAQKGERTAPNVRRRVENNQNGPPPDWRRRIEKQGKTNPPPNVRQRIENAQGGPPRNWRGNDDRRRSVDRRTPSARYAQLRPRHHNYRDWRTVPRGRYFDRGYASVVGRYYNHHYRWWGEPGWRTPYRPWRIGYYLPRYSRYYPVPWDLYHRLPPPPYGCRYVRYGNDILLIAVSSLLVLDALMLIDAYDGYDDGYYDYYDDGYYDGYSDDDYYYDDDY